METSKHLVLSVERDSVCAGDDIDAPHTKQLVFQAKVTITEVLSAIVEAGYLAMIAGGKATWIVEVGEKPVAVVAQQWELPSFLIDPAILLVDFTKPGEPTSLFFRYWCQVDPKVVFECLSVGRPLPDRYGGISSP